MEQAFFELDAPVARLCGAEVPMLTPNIWNSRLYRNRNHRRNRSELIRKNG